MASDLEVAGSIPGGVVPGTPVARPGQRTRPSESQHTRGDAPTQRALVVVGWFSFSAAGWRQSAKKKKKKWVWVGVGEVECGVDLGEGG